MRGKTLTAVGAAMALAATAVVGISGASAAKPKPAKTVTGSIIKRTAHTLKPGSKASGRGMRVLVNGKVGWKLAAGTQAQYAAKTTDGGKTWRIASPALHVNAAQAPLAVSQLGAASAKVAYAFGGGQVADVTSDGGKHWYRALFNGTVMAVVPGAGKQLLAFVDGGANASGPTAPTWQYTSKNGGRTWKLTPGS
ncbi:MAG TPA: hypothetical protein VFW09_08995 [Solirubrobacteraceae bacterium]|jgi:hypothetical protein|nr:hypothetical protein [Solirubrobacteraceae bacterium]